MPFTSFLGYELRPLDRTDIPAIRLLATEAEGGGFRFVTRFLADLDAGRVAFDAPTMRFLGVWANECLVAIGGVTPDPHTSEAGVGRLRHLYVSVPARRHGAGRLLVRALESWAIPVYTRLRLRTDTSDAAHFYEALGYRRAHDRTATHERALTRTSDRMP